MDRFVKNVLLACSLLSVFILAMSFIGSMLLGQRFEGAYEKVENSIKPADQQPVLALSFTDTTEPLAYGLISAVGGFICGYCYVDVFYRKGDTHG